MFKEIFSNINFIDRYLNISNQYHFDLKESMSKFSNDEILKIFEELGYQAKYFKGENFFQVVETNNRLKLQFNIVLKGGIVEMIWGTWIDGRPNLHLSGPWGVIADNIGYKNPIRKPIFRNYEDVKKILQQAFNIYEDFKRELLKMDGSRL